VPTLNATLATAAHKAFFIELLLLPIAPARIVRVHFDSTGSHKFPLAPLLQQRYREDVRMYRKGEAPAEPLFVVQAL
jgi:hypothetical protein